MDLKQQVGLGEELLMMFSEHQMDEIISMNEIEFVSENENSRFIPVRLKPEEAKRALRYQKIMLDFAHAQYRKSIGSIKEESMRKMYNDAVADYSTFKKEYEKELSGY